MLLTTGERYTKAREAEFYINCFDNNCKFSGGLHVSRNDNKVVKCTVTKELKHRYSCLDKYCLSHMWICRRRKKLNSPTLQKQQSKLESSGKKFNFNVSSSRSQVIENSLAMNKLPRYIPSITPVPI